MLKRKTTETNNLDNIIKFIPTGVIVDITKDQSTRGITKLVISPQSISITPIETKEEDLNSLFDLTNVDISVKAFIDRKENKRKIEVTSEYAIKTTDPKQSISIAMNHTVSAKFPFSADPKLCDKALIEYVLKYQAGQAVNINFQEFNCSEKNIEFPTTLDELDENPKISFDGYTQNFRRNNGVSYKAV